MFLRLLRRIARLFDTHEKIAKERIRILERLILNKIQDTELFIEALTHRSLVDGRKFKTSNERLEFLGDAVLGLVVTRELYFKFPDKDEGFLTKIRANFVNKNALYDAGQRINLLDLIFIQNELLANENFGKKTVVADAFEALVGAIYLDAGLETATKFIHNNVINPNFENRLHLVDDNYKSQLLEFAQALKREIPRYFVIKEEGPEQDRVFTIEARIGIDTYGVGKGKNKKAAEQEAAHLALETLKKIYSTQ
ncbi:MAG: ribonuclease III [Ignavibacteria bacterium]|nr:ribonuclease III [Ignavibacteria bacterium]